ncbi:MAG: Gfo/Idh/MocA family oxidoreductase [Lysobacter sp.]|nr:Gfo/Idh/MocA family oxidoreductase [Lysobacter sp.]MDQ3268623.1 bi-domain-containing oxidoreductase [Pseudomonadota bacterium]
MRQVLQSLRDGTTELVDVPSPRVARGNLLIRTRTTLVSAGTERMLVEFGKANWLDKARQQPDKVRMVLDKMRTDGVATTVEAVRSKLDQPLALGYCNVGTVIEVGEGVSGFAVGDRVVSNGKHAEVVRVPVNLCARVPDGVGDEDAAFTVLAAIGLQGIRLANPTLGECIVVTGLGLIGLLTVQMLRAHGCRVLGVDFDPQRLALARAFGAEVIDAGAGGDMVHQAHAFSRGRGVDAVIITASTKSNDPVAHAARMCRQRGRIVLVGVVGLELSRADFYEKELSFQVSCSYGPGRYDPSYEEGGQDYPVGFVRWTEQRNFEAVLDLLASGAVATGQLVSHRFELDDAVDAYALLSGGGPSLGIVLRYPQPHADAAPPERSVRLSSKPAPAGAGTVAFIGAGNYAGRVLIPAFKRAGAKLHTVVSSGGVSATHHGRRHGFANASTDSDVVWADRAIDTVVIATRHDDHARSVLKALAAGKHVFVEKPLCLRLQELERIQQALAASPNSKLMVGFNRRFAPHVVRMKQLLAQVDEPRSFVMTVNAGEIPPDHWTQDPAVGGGRIVGEACHFIDLLRHLAGTPITAQRAVALGRSPALAITSDKATLSLDFADGSTGTIHYLANGHKGFPKERLEVFCAGRVLQLDNFRVLRGWGWRGFSRMRLWRQDKGQEACAQAFLHWVQRGGDPPVPASELLEASRAAIMLQSALADTCQPQPRDR